MSVIAKLTCVKGAGSLPPRSSAQRRRGGETGRFGRKTAAPGRSRGHLRLQQILQLHQSGRGLL